MSAHPFAFHACLKSKLRPFVVGLSLLALAATGRAVPSNDAFAAATALGDLTPLAVSGNTTDGTAQAGEPGSLTSPAPSHSVWYSWNATANATVKIDVYPEETPWDPTLHVYTGTSLANLTEVAANDDAPNASIGESSVQFGVASATTYWIQVDGQSDGSGEFILRLSQRPPANDDFGGAIPIDASSLPVAESGSNVGSTLQIDEPSPAGTNGHSLWWSFIPDLDGYYEIDVSGSAVEAILYVFTGESLRSLRLTGWSTGGVARFYGEAGVTYWIALHGGSEGELGEIGFSIDAVPSPTPPANDLFANAMEITPATLNVTVTGNNIDATREAWEQQDNYGVGLGTGSVWWSWTAPADGYVEANTFGSNFDTILHVFDGDTIRDLRLLAANDDAPGGYYESQLGFHATANTTYHFSVMGWEGASGEVTLNLLPDIVGTHPENDHFADADDLGNTVPATSTFGAEGATIEHDEPMTLPRSIGEDLLRDGRSLWWKWTAPSTGYYRAAASGDTYGSVAGYTGNALSTLDYLGDDWSRFDFRAEAGQTYHFQVWTGVGSNGGVTLEVTESPSGLELDFLEVVPGTVDVSFTGVSANLILQVTSPGLFQFGEIRFLEPSSGNPIAAVQRSFWAAHRVSGSAMAGNYVVDTWFSNGIPPGDGRFHVLLFDQTYTPTFIRTPLPVPGNGTVEIVNTDVQDLLPPVLTGVAWERRQADVTFGTELVQVVIGVTDDVSGVQEAWLKLHSPGNYERDIYLPSWSYDSGLQQFSAWVEFPEFSPAGHFTFSLIVRDYAGRESVYGPDRIGSVDVLNFGEQDLAGPGVFSISVTPDPVNVSTGSANITVALGISDLAGLNYGFVDIQTPGGSFLIGQYFDFNALDTGDSQTGNYNVVLTLPEGLPSGNYSGRVFLVDRLGQGRAFGIYPFDEEFPVESDAIFQVIGNGAALPPFESWIADYLDPMSPEAARDFDADFDGLNNLAELVFGLNPTQSDADSSNLPRVVDDAGWLAIEFDVATGNLSTFGNPPITYTGEWSAILAPPWTPVTPVLVSGNTYRVRIPIDGDPRKFLRLRISDPNGP